MKDTITRLLLKVINILFLYNVIGTIYGCLFGLLLLSLQNVISLYLVQFKLIEWYGFIVFGVLIFNLKPLISKKYEDPRIEMRLKYIRELLKEGNFSESEKRRIWRETINEVSKELSMESKDNNINNDIIST